MRKIQGFAVLVCVLLAANAWGAFFMDDFDRPNGAVGNGWATQADGTIEVLIVDNEVLIAGEQATDWVRSGLSRPIENETRVSCDFKANDGLNFHIRVDDAETSAFLEIYTWGGPLIHANSEDGGWPGWTDIAGSNIASGEYNTVVLELVDGEFTVTLNDTEVATLPNAGFSNMGSVLIASDAAAGTTGSLHIDNVQIGAVIPGTAREPSPALDATDVPRDVVLAWTAGEFANTHNVYLGTSFADVNAAGPAEAISPDQAETTYQPAELLEFGTTYYWRVDEVNAPPSNTVFKGNVWSFTVETYTSVITNVTATASSSDTTTAEPANTINGSGLSDDLHSTDTNAMWLSSIADPGPVWIEYEFDKAYKLFELWVWNYNSEFEPVLGYGLKDVTVEYSLDGVDWIVLGDLEFAQATAQNGYAHNNTVDLGGVVAQYVRLTANSNWSAVGLNQYGLSEVRFIHVPVAAREPDPAIGTEDVPLDVVLSWRPGREATSHEVYFSSDREAVADGTALVGTVTENSFVPDRLEYGLNYYWKVVEVNEAAGTAYEGDIWSFASIPYFVVDDFESYTDEEGSRIYETWIDGWTNDTGSVVGYLQAPFAERVIVNNGEQSMPLDFNNTLSPFYSEAERTFDSVQDWTAEGVTQLIVWVRGDAANTAGPLYVALEDSSGNAAAAVNPNADAVTVSVWSEWWITLSDFDGVNLARVKTMYIGVGDRDNPTPNGAGTLYIDDIRVGRPFAQADTTPVSLLANGGFEDGVPDPWSAYGATIEVVQELTGASLAEDPIEGSSCLHVIVAEPGANFWNNGLQHVGHVFERGKQYTLSAFLKCKEGTLDINFKPELAADPWTGYGDQVITMTDEWAEYSITTPVFTEDVSPATITFHIGFAATEFWVDGVRFYEGTYVPPDVGQ